MPVVTLESLDWQEFRKARRALRLMLTPTPPYPDMLSNADFLPCLRELLRMSDDIANQLPAYEQELLFVPDVIFTDDFDIKPEDQIEAAGCRAARLIMQFLTLDAEEDFIRNAPKQRSARRARLEKPIVLTGGGCKAFHSPASWKYRHADDIPFGTDLIVVYDGGSLAPYFNPSYEQPRLVRAMGDMLQRNGYKVCWLSHCHSAIQILM